MRQESFYCEPCCGEAGCDDYQLNGCPWCPDGIYETWEIEISGLVGNASWLVPGSDPEIYCDYSYLDDMNGTYTIEAASFGECAPPRRCYLYLEITDNPLQYLVMSVSDTAVPPGNGLPFQCNFYFQLYFQGGTTAAGSPGNGEFVCPLEFSCILASDDIGSTHPEDTLIAIRDGCLAGYGPSPELADFEQPAVTQATTGPTITITPVGDPTPPLCPCVNCCATCIPSKTYATFDGDSYELVNFFEESGGCIQTGGPSWKRYNLYGPEDGCDVDITGATTLIIITCVTDEGHTPVDYWSCEVIVYDEDCVITAQYYTDDDYTGDCDPLDITFQVLNTLDPFDTLEVVWTE